MHSLCLLAPSADPKSRQKHGKDQLLHAANREVEEPIKERDNQCTSYYVLDMSLIDQANNEVGI